MQFFYAVNAYVLLDGLFDPEVEFSKTYRYADLQSGRYFGLLTIGNDFLE